MEILGYIVERGIMVHRWSEFADFYLAGEELSELYLDGNSKNKGSGNIVLIDAPTI